ncbi:hypothetical protein E2C01_032045 [Portunus trituberculatus]|uniref:Uncharacterized protein n=1 Tax=Portunus trituberculatus TaxID=210409 RepID=A0A5B7EZI5_PORTR|nr:hypothetical protein [Portunus trituberculatus]
MPFSQDSQPPVLRGSSDLLTVTITSDSSTAVSPPRHSDMAGHRCLQPSYLLLHAGHLALVCLTPEERRSVVSLDQGCLQVKGVLSLRRPKSLLGSAQGHVQRLQVPLCGLPQSGGLCGAHLQLTAPSPVLPHLQKDIS